jgi:hypothetical protein
MKNSALNAAIDQRAGRAASRFAHAPLNQLVDAMIDDYVSWREECVSVAVAYENWSRAARRDQALAFTAYCAGLDREERAATSYRLRAEQVART